MDAKFPLTNYIRFVEAENENEAQTLNLAFNGNILRLVNDAWRIASKIHATVCWS